MRHSLLYLIPWVLLAPVGPRLGAQVNVRVAAVQVWTDHDLASDPRGVEVGLSIPIHGRWAARVGFDRLATANDRTGRPCAGLLSCAVEPLHDESFLRTASFGVARTIVDQPRAVLLLEPALRVGGVGADTRALQSGVTLSANQPVVGLELGLEVMVVPVARWPIAFHTAVRAGAMVAPSYADDAYTPFDGGISLGRVELGLTLRLGRGKRGGGFDHVDNR